MEYTTISDLRDGGFGGFRTIRELWNSRLGAVPEEPGVYLIVRPDHSPPWLLPESRAGHFKGQNPTIPAEELRAEWVDGSAVLYIGKAGGAGKRATLRSRLATYLRHGYGARSPHWGGRAIWQLADASEFLVAWRVTGPEDPRDVERAMIAEFVVRYGQPPFANRTL